MKVIAIVGVMLLLSSCQSDNGKIIPHNSIGKMDMDTERKAIETLLFSYRDALNASSTDSVLGLYAKDGVFMPSNAPSAEGMDGVRMAYDHVFANIQLNIEFFIEEVDVARDIACARTSSKGTTLIHATGQTIPEENRELFVLRKGDGHWKIWRYMFNKTM